MRWNVGLGTVALLSIDPAHAGVRLVGFDRTQNYVQTAPNVVTEAGAVITAFALTDHLFDFTGGTFTSPLASAPLFSSQNSDGTGLFDAVGTAPDISALSAAYPSGNYTVALDSFFPDASRSVTAYDPAEGFANAIPTVANYAHVIATPANAPFVVHLASGFTPVQQFGGSAVVFAVQDSVRGLFALASATSTTTTLSVRLAGVQPGDQLNAYVFFDNVQFTVDSTSGFPVQLTYTKSTSINFTAAPAAIAEPAALALSGLGFAAIALRRKR